MLPLRHVFVELDGSTKSPDVFVGPLVKKLYSNIPFCLARLVMMMRIFGKWPSTSCVAYDQKDQDIHLTMIILKEDLLSKFSFDRMYSYLQIFDTKNQLYSQVIPQNGQFEFSRYT